jgi:hypothetical protein
MSPAFIEEGIEKPPRIAGEQVRHHYREGARDPAVKRESEKPVAAIARIVEAQ